MEIDAMCAVENQPLNIRTRNFLLRAGIKDLRDIKSMEQLNSIRGIGSNAIMEITELYYSLGLALPPEYCMADAKNHRQKECRALEIAITALRHYLPGGEEPFADPEELRLAIKQLEQMKS